MSFVRKGVTLCRLVLIASSSLCLISCQTRATNESPPAVTFDVNDVSFLWPVPRTKADVDNLISLDDLVADGKIMPDGVFSNLMNEAKTVGIGTSQIRFPGGISEQSHAWKVAGIRVNPSAFGANPAVIQQAGVVPGIRLIVQPVTIEGDVVTIHDFTAHVVFDFVTNTAPPFVPDNVAFGAVVSDLKDIKALLEQAQVLTSGQPLDVHPGFVHNVPGFRDKIRAVLVKHLKRNRFHVISFMGIPGQFEPWIFFKVQVGADDALTRIGVSGNFISPHPSSQMLSFVGSSRLNPGPVLDATALGNGFGISTALLFRDNVVSNLDSQLFPGATGEMLSRLKVRDVADLIANPESHNTANTDCVSCHTESTRRSLIAGLVSQDGIAFHQPPGISKVAPGVLPKDRWNVRNFGWGFNFFESASFTPTVSQRAANEAVQSADMINRIFLAATNNASPAQVGNMELKGRAVNIQ